MRIYIESTIPSYVVARPSRDSIKAMRQQLTKDWWEFKRQEHDLFMSQVVLDEIRLGEPEMAAKRLKLMKPIALLDLTNEVKMLAREFSNPACCRLERSVTRRTLRSPQRTKWTYC